MFVVGLAVAVAMIGAGVWFLLEQMNRDAEAAATLEAKNQTLDQLYGNDPFPEAKNIALAKSEQVKLQKFLVTATSRFQTNQVPKDLDSQRFQELLLGTLAELEGAADAAGTKLPSSGGQPTTTTDYAFTFGPQKGNSQVPVGRLGEFAAQLADIRAICHVVFRAKVHAITSLKRAGVSTNDYGSADILTGKKPVTDSVTGAVLRPYEVQIQTFSGELGDVLAGFANTPETIVVRAVNIQRGNLNLDNSQTPVAMPMATYPGMAPGGFSRLDPALAARYGLRPGGLGSPFQPVAPPTTTVARPGDPVVEEKPIQATLLIDVIKLGTPGATSPPGRRTPKPAPEAGAEAEAAPENP